MKKTDQLNDGHVLARVESVVATDMDGETVMMSVETGRYFHLDDIATDVWRRLERRCSFGELIRYLLAEYEVPEDVCRRDTLELVEGLLRSGVLTVVGDPS